MRRYLMMDPKPTRYLHFHAKSLYQVLVTLLAGCVVRQSVTHLAHALCQHQLLQLALLLLLLLPLALDQPQLRI